jgi:hypothetical protein
LAALSLAVSALDNNDLIALQKAGLDESVIITKMQQESADYDLSTDGLIELKKAGVSDKVIQKALLLQSGGSAESDDEVIGDIASIAPPMIQPVAGKSFFVRSSLHYEKGKHLATNYARGDLLPINTEVELVSIRGDEIRLRRKDTDENVTIVNVPKYTLGSTEELAGRILADRETPLDEIPEKFARAIKSGTLRLGMTRELALMARGYPPAHETPSIDGDIWKYWSSRFVVQTVVFDGDRLIEGRGIN